jgi:hypothetical protein
MTTTDEVITERGKTYGDFNRGIVLETQLLEAIKGRYHDHYGWEMPPIYVTYLTKIIMKLSRLSITPDHIDSWTDIAGYARLVELHLTKIESLSNAKST